VRADLRALCDRMFLDLTDLMIHIDGLPITDDHWRRDDPTPDDRLAAAWQWWIDQQERRSQ
jgi:hypothetical protein